MPRRALHVVAALFTCSLPGVAHAQVLEPPAQKDTAYTIEPSPGEVGRLTEPVVSAPFDLVAFVDLQGAWDQKHPREPTIQLDQAELGISKVLMERFKLTLTLAYLGGADVAGLGATSVEWFIIPPEPGQETAQMSLVVGRLDVPFGLDWRFNNAFTRRSVTTPLAVQEANSNWSSHGIDLYGRLLGGRFYYCAWLMQARALKSRDPETLLDLDVAKGGGLAAGGRFSFRWPGLPEVGLNGAAEFPDGLQLHAVSLDLDGRWTVKLPGGFQAGFLGELIYSGVQRYDGGKSDSPFSIAGLAPKLGGYVQGGLEHERFFLMLRYSSVYEERTPLRQQTSAVAGYAIVKQHMELRFEYGLMDTFKGNRFWLQLVGMI